jgi:hypothetical protein
MTYIYKPYYIIIYKMLLYKNSPKRDMVSSIGRVLTLVAIFILLTTTVFSANFLRTMNFPGHNGFSNTVLLNLGDEDFVILEPLNCEIDVYKQNLDAFDLKNLKSTYSHNGSLSRTELVANRVNTKAFNNEGREYTLSNNITTVRSDLRIERPQLAGYAILPIDSINIEEPDLRISPRTLAGILFQFQGCTEFAEKGYVELMLVNDESIAKVSDIKEISRGDEEISIEYKFNDNWREANNGLIVYPTNYEGEKRVRVSLESDGESTPLLGSYDVDYLRIPDISLDTINIDEGESFIINFLDNDYFDQIVELLDQLDLDFDEYLDVEGINCERLSELEYQCTPEIDSGLTTLNLSLYYDDSPFASFEQEVEISGVNDLASFTVDSIDIVLEEDTTKGNTEEVIDLEQYVQDEDSGVYSFYIEGNSSYADQFVSCNISVNNLTCESLAPGNSVLELELHENGDLVDTLELNVFVNDSIAEFNIEFLELEINEEDSVRRDLSNYTNANLSRYDFTINGVGLYLDEVAYCTINDNELLCEGLEEGEVVLDLGLKDIGTGNIEVVIPLTVTVNHIYLAPEFIGNLVNQTLIGDNLEVEFNLVELFSDEDTDLHLLNYSFTVDNTNLGEHEFSCNFDNLALIGICEFNNVESTGYVDVFIEASDSMNSVSSNSFQLNHVSSVHFFDLVMPGQEHDVYHGAEFNYSIMLHNDLEFDLYNLELGFEKSLSLDATLSNAGTLTLFANDTYLANFNVTIPNEGLQENIYDLFLTANNQTINKHLLGQSETFNSIPLHKDFIGPYVNLDIYTPGERQDGQNDRIPGAVKVAIPYNVEHTFDVPLHVNVCEAVPYIDIDGKDRLTYHKEGNSYIENPTNLYCYEQEIPVGETYNGELYFATAPDMYSWMNLTANVFLDTNPTMTDGRDDYTTSSTLLTFDTMALKAQKDYDDYIFFLSGSIISPQSESTLNKNTTYNAEINFANHYAFSIVDVQGCINTFYKESIPSDSIYSLENDYLEVQGVSCKRLDIAYNNEQVETFQFRTKGLSATSSWPRIGIANGYNLNNEFIPKVGSRLYIE